MVVPVLKATQALVSHEKEFDPLGSILVVKRSVL